MIERLRGEVLASSHDIEKSKEDIKDLRKGHRDHEDRIQKLEKWRAAWPISSLGALAGGLAALAAAFLQFMN